MRQSIQALIVTIGLSLLSVLADYFLKRASDLAHPFRSTHFIAGTFIYALSAFGWIFVLRHMKLAVVGAVFSMVIVLFLALLGLTVFRETLRPSEWLGLACAILALALLGRFLTP